MSCVDSIAAEGEAQITGDATVSAGEGITLTQVGQDIEISVTGEGIPTAHELIGDAGVSHGELIVAHASNNTKGAWVELGTSTIDADGFYVQIVPGEDLTEYLLDIGVGGAGAESVILSNVAFNGWNGGNFQAPIYFYVPLPIASGTRIAARAQASVGGTDAAWVSVILATGPFYYRQRKTTATTYGAVTASSNATSVDPGATANTPGAWTQLSASVAAIDYALVFIVINADADRATASWYVDLGIGAAASETVNYPGMQLRCHSVVDMVLPQVMECGALWPAASRLTARARCSIDTAVDRLFGISVIGFS